MPSGPEVCPIALALPVGPEWRSCDGQGAEMAWLAAPQQHLTPLDALQIYALKTSPAFEAALYAGLRMAGPVAAYEEMVPQFCRQLGVGFQILTICTTGMATTTTR